MGAVRRGTGDRRRGMTIGSQLHMTNDEESDTSFHAKRTYF